MKKTLCLLLAALLVLSLAAWISNTIFFTAVALEVFCI